MVKAVVPPPLLIPPWYGELDRGALYGVFDAAASDEVLPGLAGSREPFLSLFEERGEPVLASVAPHLIHLDPDRPWARNVLDTGWGSAWSIYVEAATDLEGVRSQLRRLLMAQLPDGRKVMFRFYDPRVLSVYLPTCLPAELAAFFGPLLAFYAYREDEDLVDVFTRGADGRLVTESRPVQPRQRPEARA